MVSRIEGGKTISVSSQERGRGVMLRGLACNLLGTQARPDVYARKYLRGWGVVRSTVGRIPRGSIQELCWKAAQHGGGLRRGLYRQGGFLVVSKA